MAQADDVRHDCAGTGQGTGDCVRSSFCRAAGLTFPSPPSGTLMRGSGRGWGYAWTIRLESLLWWCCGRNKCVFITSERSTNTCFVFPIIGSKLQNASCIQIMRHPSIQEIIVKRPKQPRNGSSRNVPGFPRMSWTTSPGPVGWQRSLTSSVVDGLRGPGRVANKAHVGIISGKSQ